MEDRLVVAKGEKEGERQIRGLGLTDTHATVYKTDNQQGPIV